MRGTEVVRKVYTVWIPPPPKCVVNCPTSETGTELFDETSENYVGRNRYERNMTRKFISFFFNVREQIINEYVNFEVIKKTKRLLFGADFFIKLIEIIGCETRKFRIEVRRRAIRFVRRLVERARRRGVANKSARAYPFNQR